MRHLAWLSAVPHAEKKKLADASDEEPVSRMQAMKDKGIEPTMPPLSLPEPGLVSYLMQIGPVEVGGMDRVPISWREIHYWQQCSGVELFPWQAALLRRLSADFLAESKRAEQVDCPAPWTEPGSEANREAVDRRISAVFDRIAARPARG